MFHLPRDSRKTAVIAGTIGNIVEWYDFALYGYMASIISTLFFPQGNEVASLIATYGIFAAGFLMRPLGSAAFGWLGDAAGRSITMLISVSFMAFPTFILGVLPTYEHIGLLAPVLLIIVRLIQGLSVGGEFSSSVTYLVETAPEGRRGEAGSWANVGSLIGMLMGSGAASLITNLLPEAELQAWGWRLPFLFGGLIGLGAIFLRRNLPKSEHFKKHEADHGDISPIREALTALSNWPPYSTRYEGRSVTEAETFRLILSTTVTRSSSATFAITVILRWTFWRLILLGPLSRLMSAKPCNGT
jgi:MHS family proline/betaine transporter-like MFS transporter